MCYWQQRDLDGKVLYSTSGGMPHGRVAIADGTVKKIDILSAAKATNLRPSNSTSYQNLVRENQQLHQEQQVNRQMILMLFAELGKEPPTYCYMVEPLCRHIMATTSAPVRKWPHVEHCNTWA